MGQFDLLAHGVWGILATPFHGDGLAVDHASLERLVMLYRQAGARGVVALGVLGEAARLDSAERQAVLRTVVEAAGDLPVVAGMGVTATAPAVEEARMAAASGAHAVMLPVPSADPARAADHFHHVSTIAGVGVVVQDHPAATGIAITPAALAGAVRACGVAVAVKAEAPPTAPTIAALAKEITTPIFGGLGGVGLLDELLAGSAGAMTGFAVPEALVTTVDAWREMGYAAARASLLPWYPLLLCEAQEKVSLAVRKEILRRRGVIAEAAVRPPGAPFPLDLTAVLDAHLAAAPLPSASAVSSERGGA